MRKNVARGCVRDSTLRLSAVGLVALAVGQPALAQGVQPVAPTREELDRRQPPSPPPASRVEIEGGFERQPCALDSPEFADVRFTLRDVEFSGLGPVGPALVRPAFEDRIGKEHKVSVVCDIRDRAAALLNEAGYIVAVQVPEQSIADGRLRLDVVMARLVDVRVRGDAGGAERLIASYLERLKQQPVFNRYQAERYLLLAGDLPGYGTRLALHPAGGAPGEVVGEVTVARQRFSVDANVQNLGSKELGRKGGQLRAQFYGLTGLGDVTSLSFFSTQHLREQKTLQANHDFRLGAEGLTVLTSLGHSWARPDIDGRDLIEARSLIGSAAVSYPFVRRQAATVRGTAGIDFVNQVVRASGDALNRDRLRILFARLNWDAISMDFSRPGYSQAEPRWRAGASLEARHGIDIFNATNRCGTACVTSGGIPLSVDGADPTAGVARGLLYAEFRPHPIVALTANLRGQYATSTLTSFEQFSAGNYTVGRGYDPGTLLGDRGIGGQVEIRVGSALPLNPRKVALEAYGFFDAARVSNEDGDFLPRGQRGLSSFGGGVRASWHGFYIDTALAVPLKKTGFLDKEPNPRLLVSISRRLWPW